jgi:trk system potassium uptake protein TrkH
LVRLPVVLGNLGKIILIIGIAMLAPVVCAIVYGESELVPLAISAGITLISGGLLVYFFDTEKEMFYREGFAIVTLGWVAASLVGTLPFILTGTVHSFADALFETVSGFTTTGATILSDVEAVSYAVLFWRSLTHWLGGMGIMVLFIAIIATLGNRANQIFRAELPGPAKEKVSPRVSSTAKILWVTYVVMSVILAVILILQGMPVFDSLCHTFGTMATGGFSTKNASIGYYSPAIQWTITIFMALAGTSFALHFLAFKRRSLKLYWRDSEFKLYIGILGAASLLIVVSLCGAGVKLGEETIRTAVFQVVSICTTTGYGTVDFDQWPALARQVIFALMLVGGCAGSTAGGIKVGRHLIMARQTGIELKRMLHPRAVLPLKINQKVVAPELLVNVLQFLFLYIGIIIIGSLVMCAMGLDLVSSLTSVMTCLGNIGPGMNLLGPTSNFGFLPAASKYLLSFMMLLGRLEIFPVLILMLPEFWRR